MYPQGNLCAIAPRRTLATLLRVANPFRRKPRATITKSAVANGSAGHPPAQEKPRKVGLKPKGNWHKRNYLTEVFIPSIFTKRVGQRLTPEWPELRDGELGITWIGHASFLLQCCGEN